MEKDDRYDRQTRIKGWNQDKLKQSTVFLIGSDKLSDFVLVDLLALGIGNIFRIGQSNYLPFEEINPDVYLEQTGEQIVTAQEADRIIEPRTKPTIVLDCTNNLRSKIFAEETARKKGLDYYSAFATSSFFSFTPREQPIKTLKDEPIKDEPQTRINSMLCSAILSDEIRKKIMPLETDLVLPEYQFKLREPENLQGRAIQVGAGATGTFTALALASLGTDLLLMDYDVVERSNLNRQFLFYDSIGLNKAKALAEKVREIEKGNVYFLDRKFKEGEKVKNFNFMFSCVDNQEARHYMNESVTESRIPLFNCGSSVEGCNATVYVPEKTTCLDCQIEFTEYLARKEKKGDKREPHDCFNPSLIIPNQIAGALMIKTAHDYIQGRYKSYGYQSGLGLETREINDRCYTGCKHRNE